MTASPTPPAPLSAALTTPLTDGALQAWRAANTPTERMNALAGACRALLGQRWERSQGEDRQRGADARRVHYLSMEFLMGRAQRNALDALGLSQAVDDELRAEGLSLADVLEAEPDAALGNGGLGRLAACFLDSFAELGLPSFGYGLRYHFGMFAQDIVDGRQVEHPDHWMRHGNPWEIERELDYRVGFGGSIAIHDGKHVWTPAETVGARAFDFIVPAHASERVSTLRQWQAVADASIDFTAFCQGDHLKAGAQRLQAEAINWVLYPDDSTDAGKLLRLKQEAFLVSASLQDVISRHLDEGGKLGSLGDRNVVHLNDTHPALAPAELMRLLLDEHDLDWDAAWAITTRAVSYTNHTLMPEALETWPLWMFEQLLPRHLEIILEINRRFLFEVRQRFPGDEDFVRRVSLIDEGQGGGQRRVRMAHLAVVASSRVNGVSQLHSDLMVDTIFADFAKLTPHKFFNVTNGVTPRRWLMQANPSLSALLDARIGNAWRGDLARLADLHALAGDVELGRGFLRVKQANKTKLAALIERRTGVMVRTDSLFDVQIKRIHEYKRQLLNVLHVVARYQAILDDPNADWVPRTVIIAGKAASAYHTAKQIIRLIHDVAAVINQDPRSSHLLKLVFLPNYGVSLAETILPAADLSEQISTAGTEASGTGNMKFALNGALTIGTWDGANIEMAQHMGVERMFVFGERAERIEALKQQGYDAAASIAAQPALARVLDAIESGAFNAGEPQRYETLVASLRSNDRYFLSADFADYLRAHGEVDVLYRQPAAWAERALHNVAGMGFFSSDRTIAQYLQQVWGAGAR